MRKTLLLALGVTLAGCYGDYVGDYREVYPVNVRFQPAALPLAFADNRAELSLDQQTRLDDFIAGYRNERSGNLVITANPAGTGDPLATARAQTVYRRALAAGVAPSAIEAQLRDSDSRPGEVIVMYQRTVVDVPSCGDWSKNTAIDATNTTGSNFGCATQRGLALQASDPADLVRMRVAGELDAQRASDIMQKYRTGRQTGAPQPVGWTFSNSFAAGTGGGQ
jgi:pilus assembly protein CpaD